MSTTERTQFLQFVAAARAVQPRQLVRRLILHFMTTADCAHSLEDVRGGLKESFAFEAAPEELQLVLRELTSEGFLEAAGKSFRVKAHKALTIRSPIDEARELERVVRAKWLATIGSEWPSLPRDDLWSALQRYLSAAFRRHGLQAAAFLFPSVQLVDELELSSSLTELLDVAVKDLGEHADTSKTAIASFLTQAPDDPDRRLYLQQLADGAVLFYTYTAPPESAALIRRRLETITLVLDTNFLFGILDLHANPYVAASQELMRIRDEGLPLKLVYHPATLRELKDSIAYWAGELKRDEPYPQQLSRGSLESVYLSGIVRKYHELNAAQPTPVAEFLRRFTNVDLLLAMRKIEEWSEPPSSSRVGTLAADYALYLQEQADRRKREHLARFVTRTQKTQAHDTELLDAVITARSEPQSDLSTLLLLTCDYHLFAFDNMNARGNKRSACTVLPNILWQALRACVEPSLDFDRSFAAVFAIPEFRTISSTASTTSVRVLGYLAALYKDLNADVAARLLSSTALMERLRDEPDDEMRAEIAKAVTDGEQNLLEDRTAALEAERKEAESLRERLEELQLQMASMRELPLRRPETNAKADWPQVLTAVVWGIAASVATAVAIRAIARWADWQWFLELRMVNQIVAFLSMLFGTVCAIRFLPRHRRAGLVTALVWGLVLAFVSWLFGALPAADVPAKPPSASARPMK